jgi:AcrR family transcriptional regulator
VAIKIKLPPKTKRRAGTRAGLTRATIAAKAAKQLEAGADGFSLRSLASAMGVVPTSITSHFRGGVSELFDEIVKSALKDVARPYKPNEDAASYLGDLFFAILTSLHGRSRVAELVVLHLSANPLLVPLLAERLLASLSALEAPKDSLPKLLAPALGVIFEMAVTESFRSKGSDQRATSKQVQAAIEGLSPTEFPHLTEYRDALVAEVAIGAAAAPTLELALAYSRRLISLVPAKGK